MGSFGCGRNGPFAEPDFLRIQVFCGLWARARAARGPDSPSGRELAANSAGGARPSLYFGQADAGCGHRGKESEDVEESCGPASAEDVE